MILIHIEFMAWTVANAHYPALFIGGFLFYLGFARHQHPIRTALILSLLCSSVSFWQDWSYMAAFKGGGLHQSSVRSESCRSRERLCQLSSWA